MNQLLAAIFVILAGLGGCDDFFTKDIEFGVRSGTTNGGGGSGSSEGDDDADGLSNSVEAEFSLDELNADSDRDGYSDGLEFVNNQADPLDSSVSIGAVSDNSRVLAADETAFTGADTDEDGLSNAFESANSLDPDNYDTDGDGYGDGLELVGLSDPFDSSSFPTRTSPPSSNDPDLTVIVSDLDGDGLSSEVENSFGTLDTDPDTDDDGFSDSIEILTGSSPTLSDEIPDFNVPSPQ